MAERAGASPDDVIVLLDPRTYLAKPEEVVLLYKTLMASLEG